MLKIFNPMKTFTKLTLAAAMVVVAASFLEAQNPQDLLTGATPGVQADSTEPSFFQEETYFNHLAIGVSTGTKGLFGADITFNFISRLNIRVGYNHLTFQLTEFETTLGSISGEDFVMNADLVQSNVEVLLEWALFKGKIRLVAGPVFGMDNRIDGDLRFAQDLTVNDITLTPTEIGMGTVNFTNTYSVFPYIGIGIGRSVPMKRIGVNLDLGTYYKGSPDVQVNATGLLSQNVDNEAVLNKNLREAQIFNYWPVVAIRLAARLF